MTDNKSDDPKTLSEAFECLGDAIMRDIQTRKKTLTPSEENRYTVADQNLTIQQKNKGLDSLPVGK